MNFNKKGFTLIETLVAITILVVATTTAMGAIQASLQQSLYAQNQITAYYLAEEALEYVQNVRDTNALTSGRHWLDDLPVASTLRVDTLANGGAGEIVACSGSTCRLNYEVAGDGVIGYRYGAGTPSPYTREVVISRNTASYPDEVTVTAKVTWTAGRFSTTPIELKTVLFNWE